MSTKTWFVQRRIRCLMLTLTKDTDLALISVSSFLHGNQTIFFHFKTPTNSNVEEMSGISGGLESV